MSIQSATPYFILNGKVEHAIALYQRALGARVETLQRFGDVDRSCPDAQKQRVMHAVLRVGNATLMMSDGPGEGPLPDGGSVNVALDLTSPEDTRRAFDQLAASGTVIEPIFDAPWGALFGVVRDEMGIQWMFNCAKGPR
ncbi:MAG: VOC family protein [Vicinamibacteraceae bacterium]